MKKSSTLVASLLIPTLAAALGAPSCAGGETATGTGSGGSTATGSGGRAATGSGGFTTFGSGGSTVSGSGGGTTSGTGGRVGSGGSTFGTGGGTTFGTGGGTTFGTGGATTTGSGGATVSTGALTVMDGYGMSGTWMGYAYTFVGPATGSKATIAPATFMAMTTLCASGMITADTTYASVAGMGWNINQAKGTTAVEPPIMTVATSGTGLAISVGSVTGLTLAPGAGSQLRAQIKTAAGDYCAAIPAAGTSMIPWAMFNTKCWNTAETGAAPFTAGTAIKAVELVIPSTAAATIGPFNMCLVDAKPY